MAINVLEKFKSDEGQIKLLNILIEEKEEEIREATGDLQKELKELLDSKKQIEDKINLEKEIKSAKSRLENNQNLVKKKKSELEKLEKSLKTENDSNKKKEIEEDIKKANDYIEKKEEIIKNAETILNGSGTERE